MKDRLQRIAAHLERGAYVNEAAVRIGIIEPILTCLGWDATDPLTVLPEYSSQGRRVDYALCAFPARPIAFIEAKAIGKVEAADRQLFEYAFHEGVPFAILTDGRTWSFYLPSAQGSYEDRRLYKLDIQERSPDECEKIFTRYLSYARLRSGEAQSDAQKDYASRANERVASDTLSRAWAELIGEPEPLLIELLVERTEALCGIRPTLETAESFLLGNGRFAMPPTTRHETRPVGPAPSAIISPGKATTTKQAVSSSTRSRNVNAVLKGHQLSVKDATSGFLELLRGLATEFPDRMQQIATAARGRTRNHIAQTPMDVYPDRPDLVHTVVELVPGWYVGTNVANREKLRIVRAATEASGMQFGSDVIFDLPNA